jgi:hypothetical protein
VVASTAYTISIAKLDHATTSVSTIFHIFTDMPALQLLLANALLLED